MRDFAAAKNTVEIRDGLSGDDHEIYYRMPTNEERAAYQNSAFARSGNRLKARLYENRIKFGSRIITGFKKGSLGIGGKPFSSDESDPDYRADWKDLLVQHAGDIVSSVAVTVFESTGVAREAELDVPLDE